MCCVVDGGIDQTLLFKLCLYAFLSQGLKGMPRAEFVVAPHVSYVVDRAGRDVWYLRRGSRLAMEPY